GTGVDYAGVGDGRPEIRRRAVRTQAGVEHDRPAGGHVIAGAEYAVGVRKQVVVVRHAAGVVHVQREDRGGTRIQVIGDHGRAFRTGAVAQPAWKRAVGRHVHRARRHRGYAIRHGVAGAGVHRAHGCGSRGGGYVVRPSRRARRQGRFYDDGVAAAGGEWPAVRHAVAVATDQRRNAVTLVQSEAGARWEAAAGKRDVEGVGAIAVVLDNVGE